MSKTDPNLAGKLQHAPTYQAALRGEWTAPGLPNTPGFRAQHLRAAAEADGITIPSGYAFDEGSGSFTDANADHWYSDPRVLGPAAVAGTGLGLGLFAGPAAGAAGASASAGDELIPATFSSPSGAFPAAVTSGTYGAGAAGSGAALGGMAATGAGAGKSAGSAIKDWITDPKNIAGLAATIPAIAGAAGAGNTKGPLDDPTVQQLLQMNLNRQKRTDPLHDSITQLAMAMLPTSYQR